MSLQQRLLNILSMISGIGVISFGLYIKMHIDSAILGEINAILHMIFASALLAYGASNFAWHAHYKEQQKNLDSK